MGQAYRCSQVAACVITTVLLAGCGSGSSSDSTPITPPPNDIDGSNNNGATQPGTGVSITLLQRIESVGQTRNGLRFYWACNASRRNDPVAYLIAVTDNFSLAFGTWASSVDVTNDTFSGSEEFRVTGGSENSLVLSYESIGAIEELTNISFVSDTNWTAFSSTEGTLECFANSLPLISTSNSLTSRRAPATYSSSVLSIETALYLQDGNGYSVQNSDGSSGKLAN